MPIVSKKKQLGQKRLASTSAAPIYHPPTNGYADIDCVIVCNTTASAVTYSLYNDKDGTNFTTDTLIYDLITLPASTTHYLTFDGHVYLESASSYLGAKASVAGSVNFTVYGVETIET
jgi:hypothetical protein